MEALEKKILSEGEILPGDVLKVGSFLNQQMDVDFLMEMGKEIARLFGGCGITKILTIEASGIALAVAAGAALHCPAVFAKKHASANLSGELLSTRIHSYTHGTDNTVVLSRDYLPSTDRVLIVDDFLASGEALNGLIDLVGQAGASLVGAAVAVEKGFQRGGDTLRAKGIRVESLALIESMSDDSVVFRR